MENVKKKIGYPRDFLNRHHVWEEPITVAVLDSGIYLHRDLSQNTLMFRDFVNNYPHPYDDNGHGTHICGIIGGMGSAFCGLCPGVHLAVGKVLDKKGNGSCEAMRNGLEWVLENQKKYNIRVLNISVSMNQSKNIEKRRELKRLMDCIWNENVVVICAAGNEGPKTNSISALALGDKVVGVGCFDMDEGSTKGCAAYSGRGEKLAVIRKPDLVAPGMNVLSCGNGTDLYVKKSGTSMSAAVVSGVVAMALGRYQFFNNQEIRYYLTSTAKDLGLPWNMQGFGMLKADAFMQKLKKNSRCFY